MLERSSSPSTSNSNPFERVPLDLFVALVHFTLGISSFDEFPCRDRAQGIQRLRLVSKRWNVAIESTPTVWTVLDSMDPAAWTIKSIERAGQSKLHIRHDTLPNFRRMDFITFLDITTRVVDRWQSLFVVLNQDLNLPPALLAHPAPHLRHIAIRHNGGPRMQPMYVWAGMFTSTPYLASLRIHSQPITWNSEIFTSTELRRFEIHAPPDTIITLESFLDILSGLPRLTHLTVFDIPFQSEGRRTIDRATALNELVQLQWYALTVDIRDILKSLQYPASCEVAIGCSGSRNDPAEMFGDIFSSLAPQLSRLHETCGKGITLTVSGYGWTNISTESQRFWVEFDAGETLAPLIAMLQKHAAIFELIPCSLVYQFTNLRPTNLPREPEYESLTRIVSLLPRTSTLTLIGAEGDVLDAVEAVYRQYSQEQTTAPSIFPALRAVEVNNDNSYQFYKDLVVRLGDFNKTQSLSKPPTLLVDRERNLYPPAFVEFMENCTWAAWLDGPAAVWEDFSARIPSIGDDGQLVFAERFQPSKF